MPRVSVIIPAFNRRRYLPEALASVWAQTYEDFEVLVVDDGSTDGTREYLEGLEEPRLRVLARPHRGASAAANAGIRAARGELVARLDSDDVWLPDMLEAELAALDAHPEAGLVYARAELTDARLRLSGKTCGMPPRFPDRPYESMLYEDCTTQCTIVARRAALLETGLYDESLRANEDWDLWLRFARNHPMVFVDRVTALYRQHGRAMTSRTSKQAFGRLLESRVRVLDKAFAASGSSAGTAGLRAIAYANLHGETAVRYLYAGRPVRAARATLRAMQAADRKAFTFARIVWFSFARIVLERLPGGPALVAWTGNVRRRGARRVGADSGRPVGMEA